MTTFGPWITPPPSSIDVTVALDPAVDISGTSSAPINPTTIRGRDGSTFDWYGFAFWQFTSPSGTDILPGTVTPSDRATVGARMTSDINLDGDPGGPPWTISEQKILVSLPDLTYPPATLPSDAVGVDYRGDGTYGFPPATPDVDWVTGSPTVEFAPISSHPSGDGLDLHLEIRVGMGLAGFTGAGLPNDMFNSDGDTELAAKTVLNTDTIPAGGAVTRTYTVAWDPALLAGTRFLLYTFAFGDQLAGTPAPAGIWMDPVTSYRLRATYQPPNYRFAYDDTLRPPLAHRQRLDGTDTAGPQLAQVGTAGGRPPLAWRQNTP